MIYKYENNNKKQGSMEERVSHIQNSRYSYISLIELK